MQGGALRCRGQVKREGDRGLDRERVKGVRGSRFGKCYEYEGKDG